MQTEPLFLFLDNERSRCYNYIVSITADYWVILIYSVGLSVQKAESAEYDNLQEDIINIEKFLTDGEI